MGERRKLSASELTEAVKTLNGWTLVHGKLHREFKFRDFKQAFGFMASVALIAESLDHHPDWANVYNKVIVELSTHDLGGISTLDIEFARSVEKLLS